MYQKVSYISSPTGFFCPTYYIFFPKQCLLAAPVVFIPLFWITGQTFHTPPSRCTLLDPLPVVCLNTICSWQGVTFKYLTKQVMGKTQSLPGANGDNTPRFSVRIFLHSTLGNLLCLGRFSYPKIFPFEQQIHNCQSEQKGGC